MDWPNDKRRWSLVPEWSKYSTEHFDRENRGVESLEAVQFQMKCHRESLRRQFHLGAEKRIRLQLQ
jgi:hypothetical protein